jgi:hypothetical protein
MESLTLEKVYEMLWDCKYCGQLKNLGVTHRHCPSCGAPQDASARYFPPDSEKIAVSDHPMVGADRLCGSCSEAQGAACRNCGHCGAPLEGTAEVARRADQVFQSEQLFLGETAADARAEFAGGGPPPPVPQRSAGIGKFVVMGIVAVLLAAFGLFFFWKKDVEAQVTSLTWTREQAVEQYRHVTKSAWCDALPRNAKELGRSSEKRSTEKVPDGESCQTRKIDQGNGSFVEKEECSPKYRDVAVMADKCTYQALEWAETRVAKSSGTSSETPTDPQPNLARTGDCVGCERLGRKTATYSAKIRLSAEETDDCDLAPELWAALKVGSSVHAQVRQLTGGIDCSSVGLR